MFEKSLYDLIRGLRNHKGNEREYIQNSIRECRKEIKSQDMDLKATAVLKLTYLEMFGNDMSWASFNVLEVMSSPKYLQKRVGYLGAVQSFRPDTEILLLAENLLKKDLTSPQMPTISLPLAAIPHVISPSMANSLLSDLLPRLNHSDPGIRKKTVVTLYRLALSYPETLRPAWPRIKERLLDEEETAEVTAAVVNVVCELGWRRPQDFLPLAPRLFELLVDGSNNWMAIKIIKLFATLTPLEPRLVKKLLPPLTAIIKSTPAMSLLYECISGIIEGGILQNAAGTTEGDEIAKLCVGKLRGMLVIEGDPNLKYVALLAFNKIVELHPYLVSMHEDVILECIDDGDVSIRLQALDLVVGMVNSRNLQSVVERLLRQLTNSPVMEPTEDPSNDRIPSNGIVPAADDSDDEEQTIRKDNQRTNKTPALPDDYRINILQKILDMCNRNNYSDIDDFDWYIDVLVQLVKHTPDMSDANLNASGQTSTHSDIGYRIGCELRNVAVRVKTSRTEATLAADSLIAVERRSQLFPPAGHGATRVLEPAVWIVGEYNKHLRDPDATLSSIIHSSTLKLPAEVLAIYVHSAIKVMSSVLGDERMDWTAERKSTVQLTLAKITHFLEQLTDHPDLEVQERAAEYIELTRLASEAVHIHKDESEAGEYQQSPLLLTQAIPSLFKGADLNPVARDAQRKVPVPEDLDLDQVINPRLQQLLHVPDLELSGAMDEEFDSYYYQKAVSHQPIAQPAAARLDAAEAETSYQAGAADYLDAQLLKKKRDERRDRNKDDPFYIPSDDGSGTRTPIHDILRSNIGTDIDVDSIPIMQLDLGDEELQTRPGLNSKAPSRMKRPRRQFEILGDENIGEGDVSSTATRVTTQTQAKSSRALLQLDSSALGSLALESDARETQFEIERREAEEAEMQVAMREVEKRRLEMQRAAESVGPANGDVEGTIIKRKKKKKPKIAEGLEVDSAGVQAVDDAETEIVKKKKKKKKKEVTDELEVEAEPAQQTVEETAERLPKKKKKKRREINLDGD